MRYQNLRVILFAAAGLALVGHTGTGGAQSILATGPDANVTDDGLHRIDPEIMEAAWIKPDLDLSRFTRIYLVPTAIQFRDVPDKIYDARSRIGVVEFPVDEERKEWLRTTWRQAVEARFARETSYGLYDGVATDVLVVHGMLADVVSHIPPTEPGSFYTFVKDPWIANVVLELRDGSTGELLARTIDRRHAEGLMDLGTVWMRTEDLVTRWADVLHRRLDELSDLLGGRGRGTPEWAR
ncbi:MAG TPA: hypothetical protein VIV14_06115 [Gammaproteobacteria bacterium]